MAIGIVGDAGVRATAQQPKLFVGMILILIFAEALALYGLIVGISACLAGKSSAVVLKGLANAHHPSSLAEALDADSRERINPGVAAVLRSKERMQMNQTMVCWE